MPACLNLPQTQTKACVTGFETADGYQIQPQTVPEHGMLYPALKILPYPSRKQHSSLNKLSSKRTTVEECLGYVIYLSVMLDDVTLSV